MKRWLLGMVLVVSALGGVGTACADYEAGQRAWDAGRHSEALQEWQAGAKAGDAKAMLALGRLYVQGLGVPQNYVQAHVWFSLAASRFEAEGLKERDALATRMTAEQVAEAQKMAATWQPGDTPPAASANEQPAGAPPPNALHRAAKAGNLKELEAALAAGMDVNARDDRGWTALMYVVNMGDVLLLEPLLQAKADVNLLAPDGATALFMAAAHGHSELISVLMKAGADPTIKGPGGKTVREVAQARYGDAEAAWEHGEDDAVLAMLAGTPFDDFAFARADSLWTVEAYADYIATYPSGRHVEKARRWQAALKKKAPLSAISPAGTMERECADCPEMIVVPAGRFRMGDQASNDPHDRLVRDVTIAYPLAVGKYEVTFAEWDACVASGGCTHQPDDIGWGRGSRPVINVSWFDAQEYVRWLSRETGQPYRLLSEAEWEYVARGGTETTYWWGNDSWFGLDEDPRNYANYGKDECCDGLAAGKDRWVNTSPVGSFEANAFGLFDTAGNVWEWVEDLNGNYEDAPSDGSARRYALACEGKKTCGNMRAASLMVGSTSWFDPLRGLLGLLFRDQMPFCSPYVVRGGSWSNPPASMRSSGRSWVFTCLTDDSPRQDRVRDIGFRVARTLD
ncbi:MAG: SUMF1/EgtB/PvdO family nonheme iron enzyme [Nitrospira sp.]|nr:SUMF1/EgtB/PvdO family nonheme iron enzyme [Nitrospira sp.]